ncbi:MAG: hypothetical protein IKQ75_09885 [Bacteroidales bacterium]|nr:hypothetical protein [Bacteroidales bacterium]MBR6162155.1 hypothetical protein [Bacteroidales bacterium]
MAKKIRVYGQSQKWTALGIVAAYLELHPNATLSDLQKAFPKNEIGNEIDTVDNIVGKEKDGKFDEKLSKQITDMDMFLTLKDGTKVAFANPMWPADKFKKIEKCAERYGIEIAEYKEAEKGVGKRGNYSLEVVSDKKKTNWLLWLIIAIIILGVIAYFALR